MSMLIKQTCCVIIYLRLWAHSRFTRTTDPQCNWLWKQEHISSIPEPASVDLSPERLEWGKDPTLGSADQSASLSHPPSPLLPRSGFSMQAYSQLHHFRWGLTTHCTPAIPGGCLLTGSSSGSELDLFSSHSSATHYCCHLYWGKETLSHATEEKVKGGVNANFLAHFLALLDNSNNKNNSYRYWIFTLC